MLGTAAFKLMSSELRDKGGDYMFGLYLIRCSPMMRWITFIFVTKQQQNAGNKKKRITIDDACLYVCMDEWVSEW